MALIKTPFSFLAKMSVTNHRSRRVIFLVPTDRRWSPLKRTTSHWLTIVFPGSSVVTYKSAQSVQRRSTSSQKILPLSKKKKTKLQSSKRNHPVKRKQNPSEKPRYQTSGTKTLN